MQITDLLQSIVQSLYRLITVVDLVRSSSDHELGLQSITRQTLEINCILILEALIFTAADVRR
jgi:hypothetical protein